MTCFIHGSFTLNTFALLYDGLDSGYRVQLTMMALSHTAVLWAFIGRTIPPHLTFIRLPSLSPPRPLIKLLRALHGESGSFIDQWNIHLKPQEHQILWSYTTRFQCEARHSRVGLILMKRLGPRKRSLLPLPSNYEAQKVGIVILIRNSEDSRREENFAVELLMLSRTCLCDIN